MTTQQRLAYVALAAIMVVSGSYAAPSAALTREELQAQSNALREQIAALNNQINEYEAQTSSLAAQATSLEQTIALLQVEQANIQAQIDLKQAEYDQIVLEIESLEARIENNQNIISLVISQYYYNSGVSTIERIASSENFSSYIDNEMRLSSLADTVLTVIEENRNLKATAEKKRTEAEKILADLDVQKEQLEQKKSAQSEILAATRASEAEYQALKENTRAQREVLQEEQNRILAQILAQFGGGGITAGDPNKGGYPYSGQCPAASWEGWQYADRWGMYICECVSYAAWKVHQNYGNMPYWGGIGNANQWPGNAMRMGIPYGTEPKNGSVGIQTSGPWGHAVWVEYTDGTNVHVSQYNYNWPSGRGEYSEMTVNKRAFDYYIYFGDWY